MIIEISKPSVCDFLRLANLKGEIENKELLINFTKEKLLCEATSSSKFIVLRGELIGEFDDWGKLGIDDLSLLKNFTSSLSTEKVSFNKKENKLIVKAGRTTLSSILRNSDYILNKVPDGIFDKLKEKTTGNEFILNDSIIKQIIEHYGTVNAPNLKLQGEGDKITLTLENQSNELVVDFDIKEKIEKFEVNLSKLFVDLLSIISGDLTVSIKDSQPVYIKTATQNCTFEYIVTTTK